MHNFLTSKYLLGLIDHMVTHVQRVRHCSVDSLGVTLFRKRIPVDLRVTTTSYDLDIIMFAKGVVKFESNMNDSRFLQYT